MSKVFIVEDDEIIANMVAEHLKSWKMEVRCANGLKNVTEEIKEFSPDIVLMDINLPYYNGFYWCAEIRKFSKIPIVFLSSADDNMNIVMAMNMGGDDFIAKPFDLAVLSAKLQAVLRRSYGMELKSHTLDFDGISLDLDDTTASYKGEKIEFTKNEFIILKTLFEKIGKVVSRDELMEKLWGNDEFVDDNTLTVNIARVRKKFEQVGADGLIRTKRGLGYIVGQE